MSKAEGGYKKTTIVFPQVESLILLGMKKRGFGEGWWNGFGGKLEGNETYEESAKREAFEEVNIHIHDLTHVANLLFYFENRLEEVSRVYTVKFTGNPVETDEMLPKLFDRTNLPYDKMWPADRIWVPKVLNSTIKAPLGFIVNFNDDKSFKSLEETGAEQIEDWF